MQAHFKRWEHIPWLSL